MRLSKYFLPTTRKVPANAKVPSHILSIRAGLIRQVSRGVYNILPIGYKVIKKIETIIREEMDKIGAQEILMPVIQPAELWQETGRWGEYGFELMRLKDRLGRDMCLGPTHEELITELIRKEVHSYKQLPINLYQIQVKFRDEIRPRFGLLRGREFIMKDAYSFHATWEDLDKTYEDVKKAYSNIIEKCGLDYRIVEAESGIIGGKVNHEFMILAETGEEEIFYCTNCDFAVKKDLAPVKVEDKCPNCQSDLIKSKAIEVGHIFQLGTKYSDSMQAYFLNKEGNSKPFIMGCYGFGVTRLLSAAIEQKHYENQITWPIQISPFKFHMILINSHKEKLKQIAEELYQYLLKNNIEVLYDDREISAGIKFNDADLIGIPMIGIIGNQILKTKEIEIKNKIKNKKDLILKEDLLDYITTESNI
ncbi:MAG: proline--tRNA ligase [Candidatus Humimicrobiia bacterium]